MADGRIEIDSAIDDSGVESGLKELVALMERMAGSMDSAAQAMTQDGIKIQGAIKGVGDEAEKTEKRVSDKMKAIGGSMTDVGGKMTAGVTAPIVAFAGAALKTASDFEGAQGRMQAQLGLTEEQTKQYGEVAKNVWKNAFGENIQDVTDSIALVKQNIQDLNDADLQKVTEQAFTLQDIFGAEISESTRTASVMMKNFGIDATSAMDLMTVGFQKGGNYSDELLDTMREYAPSFSTMGHSAEDMMNILISGAEAGAWNLDKVGDAVKEFNIRAKDGSDATAEGFEAIGLNAAEMGTAIAEGGAKGEQAFQATIAGLAAMEDPIERNAAGVALFGTTWEDLESDVIQAMANGKNHVEGFEGATERAGEAAYDSFGSRMTTALRTAQEALLPVGEKLLEVAERILPILIGWITQAVNWFTGMSSTMQNVVLIFGAVAAAIGPLLVGLGFVISSIAGMIPVIIQVWGWLSKLKPVFTAIRTAMMFLTGPVGIITAIIIALAILIYKNWDQIKVWTIAAWTAISTFLSSLWEWIKTTASAVWEGLKAYFQVTLEYYKTLFTTIWNTIKTTLSNVWNGIKSAASAVWDAIKAYFTTVLNAYKTLFTNIWNGIKTAITTVWNAIKTAATNVFNAIKSFFTTILNGYKNLFTNIWNAIKSTVTNVVNAVKSAVTAAFNNIKSTITNVLNSVKSTVSNIWNSVKSTISNAVTSIYNTVKSKFNSVLSFIKGLGTSFYNAGKGLIDQIAKGITNTVGKVTGAVKDVAQKIRNFLPFSPAKDGPLSDLDRLDFGGPIQDSIQGAIPKVKAKMAHLLQMPSIGVPSSGVAMAVGSGGGMSSHNVTNNGASITLNYTGNNPEDGKKMADIISRELYKGTRQTSRSRGYRTS